MCLITGHEGPICNLTFQKTGDMLASDSWDGSMKLWDLYKWNVPSENAEHASYVVCVAFQQDGKEICTGTTYWAFGILKMPNSSMKLMVAAILLEVSLVVCSSYLFQSVSYRHIFFAHNRPKAQRSNDFEYQCFIRDITSVCSWAHDSCIREGGSS
jgi:WD40 repeat protein